MVGDKIFVAKEDKIVDEIQNGLGILLGSASASVMMRGGYDCPRLARSRGYGRES